MKTIRDVFDQFKLGLKDHYEVNEITSLTQLAIAEKTGFSNAKIKAFPELELSENESTKLIDILNELSTGKPIQYILGKTEFYGLPFLVNPSVLIPRPETEELVDWAINSLKTEINNSAHIIDIGTGSGCIAISIKKHLPDFKVSAIDISATAIQTATKNAKLNQVEVEFSEEDILNPKATKTKKYKVIISNPPYVTLLDKRQMHTNVTDFEPHNALFVSDDDPLIFYRFIAKFAIKHLDQNGLLFFEINESYGQETVNLLDELGFKEISLRKDLSGRDRMLKAML